ncbi:MAG: hypothetical protein MR380_02420 [Lachnospiraceae bacterium]|nr:hypothetical protein [Lachnospiraceae bacterium]
MTDTQMLHTICDRMEVMMQDMDLIKDNIHSLTSDVASLKSDVTSLKSDVASLKTDVSTLKSDMKSMQHQINVLSFKQDRTDKRLSDLQLDTKLAERNIRNDIRSLREDVDTIVEVLRQQELLPQ